MRIKGFALLEFVFAVACTGLLTLLAGSAFGMLAGTSRADAVRSGLASSLEQARRHAAEHGSPVWMCPSRDGRTCDDHSDWSHGWLGFADRNGDGRDDEGDELLQDAPRLHDGLRLCSAGRQTRIRFRARDGLPDTPVGFTLCDLRCPDGALALSLTRDGRIDARPANRQAAEECRLE